MGEIVKIEMNDEENGVIIFDDGIIENVYRDEEGNVYVDNEFELEVFFLDIEDGINIVI